MCLLKMANEFFVPENSFLCLPHLFIYLLLLLFYRAIIICILIMCYYVNNNITSMLL